MTTYLGDYAAGDTIDLAFTTVNTSGVPTQLAGTPAVSVYKANGTTESTAGVTLTVDFDTRTGLNQVRITTASDGTFYANGNDFHVVITTGTVSGSSVVGYVVAMFSLANRAVNWGKVANPTTTVGLTNTTVGIVTLLNGLAANVITATSIAANAITSAKIAAGAIASGVIEAAELTNIADAIFKRDLSAVTGEAARSFLNAVRFLRNRWTVSAGTLTVYKEDDTTSAWTGAVTTAASDPVTEVNPT